MFNWLSDIVIVILHSKRTQLAILFGMIFFVGIHLAGDYFVSNLQFNAPMKALEEPVIHKVLKNYDKAALFALFSFWGLAFKLYKKDKYRY